MRCSGRPSNTGLARALRAALAGLADGIVAAFVYGSIAERADTATSDIAYLQAEKPQLAGSFIR